MTDTKQNRDQAAIIKSLTLRYAVPVALCLIAVESWAWNPFEVKTAYQEMKLSSAESKLVDFKAGWASDSDTQLLIEVNNHLPGPLACHSASVSMQNGSEIQKSFSPYLYIPPGESKQTGVNGVKKGQMKTYALSCNCWKKAGETRCSDPKKPA